MKSGGGAPPVANIGRRGGPERGFFTLPARPRADIPMRLGIHPIRTGRVMGGEGFSRRHVSSGRDIFSRVSTSNLIDGPPRRGERHFPSLGTYSSSYGAERRMGKAMPMDVPVGEYRRQRLNKERLKTAHHEARHVLAAKMVGAKVDKVSVKAEGRSLGRTHVRASLPAFQIIAGASVSGEGAEGYGNDLFQIAQIDDYLGKRPGATIDAAVATAARLISENFPKPVQEKIAELIAFEVEVSGDKIDGIIMQAFWEYAKEQKDPQIFEQYFDIKEASKWREILRLEQGIHADSGNLVIEEYPEETEYRFSEGEYSEEKIVCKYCGGENGTHTSKCKRFYGNNEDGTTLSNPDLTNMREKSLDPKMDPKMVGDHEFSS